MIGARGCIERLGFRGSDLLLWAFVWCVIGWNILNDGDPDPDHKVPLELFGEEGRAAVWFIAAAVASWAAFRDPPNDSVGFRALVIPPALRTLSYAFAWALGVLPIDTDLDWTGAWADALLWGCITLIVVRQAYRPEMPRPGEGETWAQARS